jgi:hypothetical protein
VETLPNTGAAPRGTTELEALEDVPVPALLLAVTVNVYEAPLTNPDTTQDNGPLDQIQLSPPDEVTVYLEIVAPPLTTGAVHDTVA